MLQIMDHKVAGHEVNEKVNQLPVQNEKWKKPQAIQHTEDLKKDGASQVNNNKTRTDLNKTEKHRAYPCSLLGEMTSLYLF